MAAHKAGPFRGPGRKGKALMRDEQLALSNEHDVSLSRDEIQRLQTETRGQLDIWQVIAETYCSECNSTGAVPAGGWEDPADIIDGYVPCTECGRGWAL